LDRSHRLAAQFAKESLLVASGGGEELRQGHPARFEPVAQVVEAFTHLGVDQCLGRFVFDEAHEGVDGSLTQRELRLDHLHLAESARDVVAQLAKRLELGSLLRPLVVGFGKDLLLHLFDQDPEGGLFFVLGSGTGLDLTRELQDVARPGAPQLVVETGDVGTGPHLVEVVLGVEVGA
jgi:hypothetical protein